MTQERPPTYVLDLERQLRQKHPSSLNLRWTLVLTAPGKHTTVDPNSSTTVAMKSDENQSPSKTTHGLNVLRLTEIFLCFMLRSSGHNKWGSSSEESIKVKSWTGRPKV